MRTTFPELNMAKEQNMGFLSMYMTLTTYKSRLTTFVKEKTGWLLVSIIYKRKSIFSILISLYLDRAKKVLLLWPLKSVPTFFWKISLKQYKVQRYLSCKSLKEAQKCIYFSIPVTCGISIMARINNKNRYNYLRFFNSRRSC